MKNFKKSASAFLTLLISITITSCGTAIPDTNKIDNGKNYTDTSAETTVTEQKTEETLSEESSSQEEQPEEKIPPTSSCTFLCVGDNLIHDNIYKEALTKGGGTTYDFTDCYKYIADYIDADVAVLNQETLVNDLHEPQSYPTFSSPLEVGDAAVDLGFNVISMSNNHVLDMGADALINSLDYWKSKNVVAYGAYRNKADSDDIRTMEVNGITFAFLGYMEHTNGISLSGDKGYVIYLKDEETIRRQIQEADEKADVVVVSCHYGTEISNELNQQQIEITPKLVEWGADIIIGTQAHALSTCEYIDKPDGGQAFVFYGLGNFFSTMYDTNSLVGLMGKMNIVKDNTTGEVTFENIKAIPLISHFEASYYDSDWYNCAVYPYAQYTDELFSKNFVEGFTRDRVEEILTYVPEEFLSIE